MRPILRLQRREILLGKSETETNLTNVQEEIVIENNESKQTIRFVFLDKKEIEFLILEQDTENTLLELTHSDIKKYKAGKYLVKTEDIKNDSSIEIFEVISDSETNSIGKTKKIIEIK